MIFAPGGNFHFLKISGFYVDSRCQGSFEEAREPVRSLSKSRRKVKMGCTIVMGFGIPVI
jgi:hypothetical protein